MHYTKETLPLYNKDKSSITRETCELIVKNMTLF